MPKNLTIILQPRRTKPAHTNHVDNASGGGTVTFRAPKACVVRFTNPDFFGTDFTEVSGSCVLPVKIDAGQTSFDVVPLRFKAQVQAFQLRPKRGDPPPIITP